MSVLRESELDRTLDVQMPTVRFASACIRLFAQIARCASFYTYDSFPRSMAPSFLPLARVGQAGGSRRSEGTWSLRVCIAWAAVIFTVSGRNREIGGGQTA